jgi:excisionase family DNA binding protein
VRPLLLTVRQAAKMFGVRRALILHLIDTGRLPTWREGGRVYLDPMTVQVAIRRAGVID